MPSNKDVASQAQSNAIHAEKGHDHPERRPQVVGDGDVSFDRDACAICGRFIEVDNMVQCDKCDKWYHYKCVDASEDISQLDWNCARCGNNDTIANESMQKNELSVSPTKKSISAANELHPVAKSTEVKAKSNGLEATEGEYGTQSELDFELMCLEEERQANLLFIRKKHALLNKQRLLRIVSQNKTNFASPNVSNSCYYKAKEASEGNQVVSLRAEQISARQAVPRELPEFSGKPEEWPGFISSFENSTRICGYSNDENLLRLQRCLKGKARECVSSQLLIPQLVPQVIETLKMIFGKPENIIQSLLVKIRKSNPISAQNLETLISFSIEVKNVVATMQASGLQTHLNNPLLLSELINKLPAQRRLDWAIHAKDEYKNNLSEFSEWLFNLATAASSVVQLSCSVGEEEKKKNQRVGFHENASDSKSDSEKAKARHECGMCSENHFIANCDKFKKMTYQEKWEFINKNKLCRTCLKSHDLRFCKERKECGLDECKAKHHRMLHKTAAKENTEQKVVGFQVTKSSYTLFKILPITIYGNNGKVNVYALLDDGSGPTLIEREVIRKINLRGSESELCLRWTDGSVRVEKNSQILSFKISAAGKGNKKFTLHDVRTVNKLDLPSQSLCMEELSNRFSHLKGLPIPSYQNVAPKMIIGLSNKHVAMPIKFREGRIDEPAANKTRIGWTVYGSVREGNSNSSEAINFQLHVCECDNDMALNKLMIDAMKVECTDRENPESRLSCKFNDYVQRTGDCFTAKLFWRSNNITLPDNFSMAMERLICFERKLYKDSELKIRITKLIHEMEAKKYIRKLCAFEASKDYPRKWYLPIFSVYNPNKPHKTRLVWDAAAEHEGLSLNKCLHSGPDLLRPLVEVLYNFRLGKIGICGDISEMFHRIRIHEDDHQSQRFLWRDCNQNAQPDIYVLQVCSFGATCSPCIALCAKNKNAREFAEEFPRAAKSILENHYMDDMLDSVDTLQEAIALVRDVDTLHKRGNFYMRNWLSNSEELLENLQDSSKQNEFCKAGQTVEQIIEPEKVLGLWWQTKSDVFMFNCKYTKASIDILNGAKLPTKRELLRLIMSVFDPLGFLSFYTVRIKILMQEVWRSGIGWDETIPNELGDPWNAWLHKFKSIAEVQIPRCYFNSIKRSNAEIDLHIFVDASAEAYAAVAYFRITSKSKVEISFVGSKTKVAPLTPISIPRMELSAAVLGSRLAGSIIKGHEMQINTVYFWSDSKTVLLWLRSDPRNYKQFVMFRIAEIQSNTNSSKWLYVPSKQNVADKATKSKNPIDFESTNEWFCGPEFLGKSCDQWPRQNFLKKEVTLDETSLETQPCLVGIQVEQPQIIDSARFSRWEYLRRSLANVKRFVENLKIKVKNKRHNFNEDINTIVTREQLLWAESKLFRIAQNEAYHPEVKKLGSDSTLTMRKNNPLYNLSPFIDDRDVIRMKGRIQGPQININVKNPIILPKSHHITRLVVDWYHRKYYHIHHETVINEIHQRFYIAGLRRLLRSIRSSCQICKNERSIPIVPEMGQLPTARTAAFMRPFSYVGVDYFGPINVTVARHQEKRYGVLFTCLTCRAVHIEVAHSLSMNSCAYAIRNFIARRGTPLHIYSDNGKNFIAAEKELRDAYSKINIRELCDKFSEYNTKWTFIPPGSPHMGGAWERMIRSTKNVLYKIATPTTKLSDEKLQNFLIEVESILNSRPLTYLSLETAEEEALTPNHFLLGSSSGLKPPGNFDSSDQYVRKSWRHAQYLADEFWKRWIAEVLPLLTRRSKWFSKVKPIEVGDVVLIVDPNLPRYSWPKGIITSTVIAQDGQVRSAMVKTRTGVYHRPAARLAVLDVREP